MKIYTKRELDRWNRRKDFETIINNIVAQGVDVDMSKYPKDTIAYLKQAILDHQDKVIVAKKGPRLDEPEQTTIPIVDSEKLAESEEGDHQKYVIKNDVSFDNIDAPPPAHTSDFMDGDTTIQTVDEDELDLNNLEEQIEKKDEPEVVHEPAPEPKEEEFNWKMLPELTNEEWVEKMYWKHLNRAPDLEGRVNYLNHLAMCRKKNEIIRTRRELEAAIQQSPEATRKRKERESSINNDK